jgi:hypothetical protein
MGWDGSMDGSRARALRDLSGMNECRGQGSAGNRHWVRSFDYYICSRLVYLGAVCSTALVICAGGDKLI